MVGAEQVLAVPELAVSLYLEDMEALTEEDIVADTEEDMEAVTEEDIVTGEEWAWAWAWVEYFQIAVGIFSLSPVVVRRQASPFLESTKGGGGVGYGFPRRDADTIN